MRNILSSTVSVVRATTIDILPDDALLRIFYSCRVGHNPLRLPFHPVLEWQKLIHVCRKWRLIIFSSPGHLDLYLLCKHGTPVRKNLDVWPAFPIIIDYINYPHHTSKISPTPNDDDNILAALEHPDRVRCLKLPVTNSLLQRVVTMALEPFPTLTQLWLSSELEGGGVSVLPSEFLGGSTPRLREIYLDGIPFPTLPAVLSSASDLVVLYLHRIPHTGYISPEVMVASLATLTRLDFVSIGFQSSTSRSSSTRRASPPTRVVLPVLTSFRFQGASEYLEDLVARIDAPCLASIQIKYFNQLIFQVPQLFRFIGQTQIIEQARTMDQKVAIYHHFVSISLSSPAESHQIFLELQISCRGLDWQVSHLAEVLSQSSAVLFYMHNLSIQAYGLQRHWRDHMDHIEWLALLCRFTTVERLRVFYPIAGHVADALKEVTAEMAPEILPALRWLSLVGEPAEHVKEFSTTRQLSGLPPVTIAT